MITSSLIHQINNEIEIALQGVATKYGVHISTGSSKYSQTEYTTKLKVVEVSQTGVAMTAEATLFNRLMEQQGKDWRVGDTFTSFPRINCGTITGYNPRSPKNDLQFEMNGKRYKGPMNILNNAVKI